VQWLLDRDSVDMADELSIYLHGIVDFDDEAPATDAPPPVDADASAEPAASAEPPTSAEPATPSA
jgi:hypothetical protein